MYVINSQELINIRRELHRIPELGGCEYKTMDKICSYLDSWGIEYEKGIAGTGVVAIVRGKNKDLKNPICIGIRADIDALPMMEETNIDFKSLHEGTMHACGHDAHATVALGTAKIIKLLESSVGANIACHCPYCKNINPALLVNDGLTRKHFLYRRQEEIDKLRNLSTIEERVNYLENSINTALTYYKNLKPIFKDDDFKFLKVWLEVINKLKKNWM